MGAVIVPVRGEQAGELGRICFEAFGRLQDRHGTPRDFERVETARGLLEMMIANPAVAGFAAEVDGRVVGSNFITFADEVAGVGPITVDPGSQSRGIGRALMRAVMEEARRRGVARVRLLQEAINTTSLPLYTSLGFDWRDSVAIVQPVAGGAAEGAVRSMGLEDLEQAGALARAHYGTARTNELRAALGAGQPVLVRERGGRMTGYLVPGFLGHGFAEGVEEMASLVSESARVSPAMFHRVFVPLSQRELFRELLRRGCRVVKLMSYMTMGPYEEPKAVWMPSILN